MAASVCRALMNDADHHVGRVAEDHRHQVVAVHAQDSEVVARAPADHLGGLGAAVEEAQLDRALAGRRHDVVVGHDIAIAGDHEAGAGGRPG
jgi:hypothetical protein